ncbi:protein ROS1C isoform X5 [Cucumis melo]|uniref:Protein ROS1C isoform X5 n=1 Tax=Cucumis melo TaxID=3656 RepID=A0ABM3L4X2_CUCME|nr:protein ROS1C isoform X5 [Cucumis melo]
MYDFKGANGTLNYSFKLSNNCEFLFESVCLEEMSVENPWVPVTPVKAVLRRPSHEEENQQKSDGSIEETEAEGEKINACSDTPNLVTLDNGEILVVDLSEMKGVQNEANCCSSSSSLEKVESISQGELSSKTIPHFVPPTPDKRTNVVLKQVVDVQSTLAGETRDEEGQEQNCKTVSRRTDEDGLQQDVFELVLDPSCASVLTPINTDNSNKDIDITVKEITKLKEHKRKHRPKVMEEGKPRTSSPASQGAANSQENVRTKRKYVRKNAANKSLENPLEPGTLDPVTPAGSLENSRGLRTYTRKRGVNIIETGASTDMEERKRGRKKCWKSLKFDNEGKQKDENSLFESSSNSSESLAHILTTGSYRSHSVLKHCNENDAVFNHGQADMFDDPNPSMKHQPEGSKCFSESQASIVDIPIEYSSSWIKLQSNYHENERGMGRISSTNHLLSSSENLFCSSTTISSEGKEAMGLKRKWYQNIKQDDTRSFDLLEEFYSIYGSQMPQAEYFPKENSDKVQNFGPSSTYFNITGQTCKVSSLKENSCTSKAQYWLPRPQNHSLFPRIHEGSASPNKLQPFESSLATGQMKMTHTRCNAQDHVWTLDSWSHHCNRQSKYSHKQPLAVTDLQRVESSHRHHPSSGAEVDKIKMQGTVLREKQKTLTSYNMDGAEQHPKLALYSHRKTSQFPPGSLSEINSGSKLSTNAMVEEMKMLDINREGKISLYEKQNEIVTYEMQNQEHNALVVYRGDGSIVPFEGSLDPVKKRRRYAKVDLDEETVRVWKLLMDNSNKELVDGSDEAKEKWWEEERSVFSGRTDSFIAKMHLIQGDRGFSQWKGSVLDSVIGVFLTQNVSDHLSSSAFMSLAARYPLKSNSLHKSSVDEQTSLILNESQVNLRQAEDSVIWAKQISDQPICKQSCTTICEIDQAEENFLTSSDSSGSNTAGVTSMRGYQCSVTSYSSKKIGELEDRRLTTEINTTVEAFSSGDEKTADAAISSQMSVVPEHSINSLCPLSIEDKIPCLKSNCGKDLSSKDICGNGSASSVEVKRVIETNKLKSDFKIAGATDSSDDSTSEEKSVCQREHDEIPDSPKNHLKESPSQSSNQLQKISNSGGTEVECFKLCREVTPFSYVYKRRDVYHTNERSQTLNLVSQTTVVNTNNVEAKRRCRELCSLDQLSDHNVMFQSDGRLIQVPHGIKSQTSMSHWNIHQTLPNSLIDNSLDPTSWKTGEPAQNKHDHSLSSEFNDPKSDILKPNRERVKKEKRVGVDWDSLRKQVEATGRRERTTNTMDSLDWEAVRCADIDDIAYTIRERGMNNRLAERIKDFLDRLVKDHGSTDLEWLRDVPPDQRVFTQHKGIGIEKRGVCTPSYSAASCFSGGYQCWTHSCKIRMGTSSATARITATASFGAVSNQYPVLESIQKYLWPRLCKLDQRTLYELHYQMITFGKVFCTKSKPNCNACPMRGECRHFASAFASARLSLPAPEEKSLINASERKADINQAVVVHQQPLALTQESEPIESNQQLISVKSGGSNKDPIIEEPETPEPECPQISEIDIEDTLYEDPDEIPTIKLNIEAFTKHVQNYMQENMELQEGSMSKALVLLSPEAASIPMPKLKNISRLRTEHQVYELPDSHPLLEKLQLERREPDDPCFYLLAIWTPGETANSVEQLHTHCSSQEGGGLCREKEGFSCNSVREADSEVVRGTLLIPCRTAMRGSFPLNGTYFQVNEVFADHDSSLNPIDVPRSWLWKLSRRTVYFGTSIPTIFKGLSTEEIQGCFWKGALESDSPNHPKTKPSPFHCIGAQSDDHGYFQSSLALCHLNRILQGTKS